MREAKAKHTTSKEAVRTACIVVPTYNEAHNIEHLLRRIAHNERLQPEEGCVELHVLVVDDSSPDGTAKLVRAYASEHRKVHLLVRSEKNGLGAAYIAGMRYALDAIRPDVVFEMDADLSHDPDDLLRMLSAVKDGADVVIGSRYVPGGRIPEDWGVRRVLFSRVANVAARLAVGGGVRDCTGGFRAIRASALRRVDLGALHVKGYVFQVSLLAALLRAGCAVREIPITFTDRKAGESKLRVRDILEFARVIVRMLPRRFTRRLPAGAAAGRGVARTP